MKRKIAPGLLASMLLTVGVIGCSDSKNSSENSPAPSSASASAGTVSSPSKSAASANIDFNEKPYTIKVNYTVLGQEQPDLSKVEAKLNEITLKEINAQVDLEGVSLFNLANAYSLKASSREKTDLMLLMPGSRYLAAFANNKMIRPLDEELAKWGPALQETVGDLLPAGKFNGKQYAIPQRLDQQLTIGFNMNKSILDKYSIDISSIKSIEDADAVFSQVHAGEPSMTMLAPETSSGNITGNLVYADGLGNQYGALMDGTGTKVSNIYESKQWINAVKKVREWYQKGYISKDVSTSQEDGSTLLNNGKVFATSTASVGFSGGQSQPIETRTVALHPSVRKTTDSQLFLWSVASFSERPDKAIQFLNLLNSSAELTTLLEYGIKGEHYEVNPDGTINTAKNANYNQNNWLLFGDYNKMPLSQVLVGPTGLTPEKFKAGMKKWNEDTVLSPAYGFSFDPTSVKTEIAALDAVNQQYAKVIGNGAVDTDSMVKKFNDALYAAGLQKVMDEKQRQLDAWLAANKK
ncbi:ABC transporter substrate-binding protein [Paenibacillus sp. TAF58]